MRAAGKGRRAGGPGSAFGMTGAASGDGLAWRRGEAAAGALRGWLARVVAAGAVGRRIGAWGFAAPASHGGVRRLVHGVLPGGWRRRARRGGELVHGVLMRRRRGGVR